MVSAPALAPICTDLQEELFAEILEMLNRFLANKVCESDRPDIVQNSLKVLWLKVKAGKTAEDVRRMAFNVARKNLCHFSRERERRKKIGKLVEDLSALPDSRFTSHSDFLIYLCAAIERMPDEVKRFVWPVWMEGEKQCEVAKREKVSPSRVKRVIADTAAILREKLGEDYMVEKC